MSIRLPWVAAVAGAVLTLTACGEGFAQGAKKPLPSLAAVRKSVTDHFATLSGAQAGALIVASEARGAIARLEHMGWRVEDADEIVRLVPADGEPLARILRTPAGRKLSAQVARLPDGYDRVDRLLRLPRGQKIVEDLVRGPDGYKLIEYLTTSQGGAGLGRQLARAPHGADFNKPTGRIYTADALLERLETSYRAAAK